jgi:uncharacterized coiled-coil protein SlyX
VSFYFKEKIMAATANPNVGNDTETAQRLAELEAKVAGYFEWRNGDLHNQIEAFKVLVENQQKSIDELKTKINTMIDEMRSIGGDVVKLKEEKIPERVKRAWTLLDLD